MTENHFVASQKGPFIFIILSYYVLYRSYVQYDILTEDFVSGTYGICKYRKILTDTDRKIPIR